MENKELTPQQAINVLYQATGEVKLNRQETQLLDKAFQVVLQLVPQTPQPVEAVE